MPALRVILAGTLSALAIVALAVLGAYPRPTPLPAAGTAPNHLPPLRLGLIPERDIFTQHKAYRALADYLSPRIGRPVELATTNTYEAVLGDFGAQRIDAAFLGSLVAVLTVDRLQTQVLVKPEYTGGISSYRGVLFVPEGSSIRTPEDLAGHSLGAVRTTTGGNLFPFFVLRERNMLAPPRRPRIAWCGTHDDVVAEVAAGRLEAGAVKDLRLEAYERAHPDKHFRRLAEGEAVPENALVVRAGLDPALREKLVETLLGMAGDAEGKRVLQTLGMTQFMPCRLEEYKTIYALTEALGADWSEIGVAGPPPRQPSEWRP